jgi:hypothetical protein
MQKLYYYIALLTALIFVPLNIFIIGNWLGAGIQFSMIKIQFVDQGMSIINLIQELQYIISGIIVGKSIFTILMWAIGFFLIIISFICLCVLNYRQTILKIKYNGLLLVLASIFFLASIIIQYGPFFHGPAGTAIPIGLPVLFVVGAWMFIAGQKEEARDKDEGHNIEQESE